MKAENHTQKAQLQGGCGRVPAYHILGIKYQLTTQPKTRLGNQLVYWGYSQDQGRCINQKAV